MGNIRVVVKPENIGEVPDVASNVDWTTYLINIGLSIALLGILYLMAAWFVTWQKARFNKNKKQQAESESFNRWVDEKLDKQRELPIHRTEAGYPNCATCDGGGCYDCTDTAN